LNTPQKERFAIMNYLHCASIFGDQNFIEVIESIKQKKRGTNQLDQINQFEKKA
jgi:hypothetical protein